MKEMVGGCCVCSDDGGWPENPLVYCDGQSCTVAVHQACYGIVTVPTGPWYCRKCESQDRTAKVRCELCPSKHGALKRTDNNHWAHVVCALYIPEVRFGNVTTMEPIQLQLIPQERFNKVCYICEERGKPKLSSIGACMQCNKSGCKQQFHVTCGQSLGLLCEEAGNYLDNVKYCGYCQHHFSKVKKGGNVKTIPPYKPVAIESESDSEKEPDTGTAPPSKSSSNSSSTSKRKSTSNSKASSKSNSSTSKSSTSSSSQKTVHNSSSKSIDKPKVTSSGSKNSSSSSKTPDESGPTAVPEVPPEKPEKIVSSAKDSKSETPELETTKPDSKESKSNKKRKTNSRTPTPITVISSENISVVIGASSIIPDPSALMLNSSEKRDSQAASEHSEKSKKTKSEAPVATTTPPVTALTTTTTTKNSTPATTAETTSTVTTTSTITSPVVATSSSIIQSTNHHSLVVSVPLHNTTLSPSTSTAANHPNIVPSPLTYAHLPQDGDSSPANSSNGSTLTASSISQQPPSGTMISSDLSSGGLKIAYEKQTSGLGGSTLQVELERMTTTADLPSKRSRSQSGEKADRPSRSKKRSSNGVNTPFSSTSSTNPPSTSSASGPKRNRGHHATPPPPLGPSTSFSALSSQQIKDSPPSSPSDESMGSAPVTRKNKSRKSAPASVSSSSSSTTKESKDIKEVKDIKIFQNGVHAPHMLGNQLNPNSNMAQKMSDHLHSELEAHSIFTQSESVASNLVGPQLHHRVIASARSSSAGGSSTASGGSGFSSMLGGSSTSIPQTLDQLLERQWEQGSQFLMEQAQHFDIASLLSCLHQLRAENLRLEEHVSSLLQRRDHLLAVNARLAIPLTGPPATPQSSHPHTVNNIHPAVAASHAETPRPRHSSGGYSSHGQGTPQLPSGSLENGLPPDPNQVYPHQHRSPATSQPQPSPNVRW